MAQTEMLPQSTADPGNVTSDPLVTTVATTIAETTAKLVETNTDAVDTTWLILGVRPEIIIVPCILLGIPALVLIYCLLKSALRKDIPTDDELWMKNKDFKLPTAEEVAPNRKRRRHHRERKEKSGHTGRNSISPSPT